jgi:acetoacetyl-CoA synthetase
VPTGNGASRSPVREGDLLFTPGEDRVSASALTAFAAEVHHRHGLVIGERDYETLWRWSVTDLEGFWSTFAEWSGVPFRRRADEILRVRAGSAEGAVWFAGAELNYVDAVTRHDPRSLAVIALDESGGRQELTYGELLALAGRVARSLARLGVERGDRVAAVLPNGIAALATFLATASLGAIWSACAPEFGAPSMLDRFQQIAPRVLVAAGSYCYGGREFDLGEKVAALAAALEGTVVTSFEELATDRRGDGAPEAAAVPFSHPLWILYSSGTTGLPKAIVQSHGGIVLEHLKALELHGDLRQGSRFFWFTTTGWMMWNYLVGGLLAGTTIVLYDGSPVHPDPMALWRMAASEKVTYFGTSAPFLESCRKLGLRPSEEPGLDLSALRTIGSTGAPLPPEGFAWATDAVADDVLVGSVSGGTDVCTAFLISCPWLPVHAGELQCAALGARVEAYSEDGHPVVGEVGELVITAPMPSMPVGLFGDESGQRLHEAYFAHYPGLWRHGDWVKRTPRGSYVVYGRSDATLNRGGVRMGTAEFYRVVEALPEVADALVIDTSELGREGELILLVVPTGADRPGGAEVAEPGGATLEASVRAALRSRLSPRHVPDRVIAVESLPRTLNGKKVEVPLRRILLGTPVDEALSRDSLAEPAALDAVLSALSGAGLL